MPYVELISRLIAQGHEVHFAMRYLYKAYNIFRDTGLIWHQAPIILPRHVKVMMPVNSFPKILHHAGYDNPGTLTGLLTAWKNLFSLIDPDLYIFDYSPTAMLAAKNTRGKKLAIGTGFHLPPRIQTFSFPSTQNASGKNHKETLEFEKRVLGIINESLTLLKLTPISKITDFIDADKIILRTLPEMDHYSDRTDASYSGIMKSPPGEVPAWPDFSGPKIFAYLKAFSSLPSLLETLNQKKYPTLIYGDKIPQEIIQRFSSPSLKFAEKPLDMDAIGNSANLAICNAGHGATTELLLAGVPLLLLPLNGEQNLVAENVERLGAGLSAPHLQSKGMAEKLELLIKQPQFREAAEKFSNSYKDTNVTRLSDTVLSTIDSLLDN
jgi:hypothetical protein